MFIHNFLKDKKLHILCSIFFIFSITFLTFSIALKNDFVNYDDAKYIANNPIIKNLVWPNIQEMFTRIIIRVHQYHPLTLLTWAIEYHFVKLTPFLYILDNILLHSANALLVFWLAYQLTKKNPIALLSALLFALHPLRVESVVWITERKDVLYAFFYLLSLNFYYRWAETMNKKGKLYLLTHVFFILSCLSKPMAVSLPLTLLSLDFLIKGKITLKDCIEKKFIFVIAGIFGIISISQKPAAAQGVYEVYNLLDRLIISINAFWFYLSKIFVPIQLSCYYPLPQKVNNYLPLAFYIIAIISILIFLYMINHFNKFSRMIQWGIIYFCFTIFFVIGLISFGSYFIAERYTYIPSVGISIVCAWSFIKFLNQSSSTIQKTAVYILIILIGILSFCSHQQSKIWHDGVQLWSNVIKIFPNTEMAINNRGNAYLKLNDYTSALKDYTFVINQNPRAIGTLSNRAAVYIHLAQYPLAFEDLNRTLSINPDNPGALNNRGALYYNSGFYELAIQDFTRSIEIKPIQDSAYINRSNAYLMTGDTEKANQDLAQARKINPNFQKYNSQF